MPAGRLLTLPVAPSEPDTVTPNRDRTVVVTEAELLPLTGSVSNLVTLAELVFTPRLVGVTRIVTVAEPGLLTSPSEHVTVVAPVQLPCEGVALENVMPAGRVSVTRTLVAASGPRLFTVNVYVTVFPIRAGSGASVIVRRRSVWTETFAANPS